MERRLDERGQAVSKQREMLDRVYSLANDYALYHFEGQRDRYFLFNIRTGKIFRLNCVSYRMLESFNGERRVCEILQILSRRFSAEEAVIREDLIRMIDTWVGCGILVQRGGE